MSSAQKSAHAPCSRDNARKGLFFFVLTLLVVELLDELVFGVREAAWPLIRDDLQLSYTQIGLVLSVPPFVGNLVEPFYGIPGDVWKRRTLILGGGLVFAAAGLLVGLSGSFTALLVATTLFNPASGAFVGLSQAALMDAVPERRVQNMARWALFGSVGNAVGPLLLGLGLWLGMSWRWPFFCLSVCALPVVAVLWRLPFTTPSASAGAGGRRTLAEGVRGALRALRRREVLRWLLLLQFGNLTWDVLRGFLALYFVDVVGVGESHAALAVVVWTWVGLPGNLLLLPLLERVRGVSYLRVSTAFVLVLFPAFLLAPGFAPKVVLLGLLGFANAGWYAILKARLYAELPGRSGTAMTLGNVFGLVGDFLPLALGAFAQRFGPASMMWLLACGPVALLAGLLTVNTENPPTVETEEENVNDA
jgi:FSR family fosmidomycin resistance protein-like MFS transporter